MATLFILLLLAQIQLHISHPMQMQTGYLAVDSAHVASAARMPHMPSPNYHDVVVDIPEHDILPHDHGLLVDSAHAAPGARMPHTPSPNDGVVVDIPEHNILPHDEPVEQVPPTKPALQKVGEKLTSWRDRAYYSLRPGSKPLSLAGDDAEELTKYLGENGVEIDNSLIEKVYASFSAHQKGPAMVHYDESVEDMIRGANKGNTRGHEYLSKYLQDKLTPQEFERRRELLIFQSDHIRLREHWWRGEAGNIASKAQMPPPEVKSFGQILGMDESFSSFTTDAGRPTAIHQLNALSTGHPELYALFKTQLGEVEFARRVKVMEAIDSTMTKGNKLPVEADLISKWQEQNLDVSMMLHIAARTRNAASSGELLKNHQFLAELYPTFEPIIQDAARVKETGMRSVRTIEDEEIAHAFAGDPEMQGVYEALKEKLASMHDPKPAAEAGGASQAAEARGAAGARGAAEAAAVPEATKAAEAAQAATEPKKRKHWFQRLVGWLRKFFNRNRKNDPRVAPTPHTPASSTTAAHTEPASNTPLSSAHTESESNMPPPAAHIDSASNTPSPAAHTELASTKPSPEAHTQAASNKPPPAGTESNTPSQAAQTELSSTP